ncbi:MAG: M28 family peptidase [Saprospiraceae bacterium]|nr:M28 family peptidase [Saprospiraceae bacterium]
MLKRVLLIGFSVWLTNTIAQKDYFHEVIRPDSSKAAIKDSLTAYAEIIQPEQLRKHIEFLASDSCEGRELGSRGNDLAAQYISAYFEKNRLSKVPGMKSYFQEVGFKWIYWDKLVFKIGEVPYKQLWDYLSIPAENHDLDFKTSEFVFLGYGIDDEKYSDYKGVDVKDKVVIIYKGEPKNKKGISYLSGKVELSEWATDLSKKHEAASKNGVKLLMVIEDQFKEWVDLNRSAVISPQVYLDSEDKGGEAKTNIMYLSSTTTSMMLGKQIKKVIKARDKINKTGKPQPFVLKAELEFIQKRNVKVERGRNVLAYVEGSTYPDEVLILSAHYDHIGKRGTEVFNGADDNASGTSSMMELARTYQMMSESGVRPKRSVIFALMTGEEKGLLGSMYYVNKPLVSLEKTMVNINIDMIGRTDDIYKTDSNYIYVIGSDRLSSELHNLNLEVNQKYVQLKMDHRYNSELDPNRFYYRSDHYNFAEKGVPAIFFFSGVHKDYHRITDDIEKIMFAKTANISRHIFYLSWALANKNGFLAK